MQGNLSSHNKIINVEEGVEILSSTFFLTLYLYMITVNLWTI